MPLYAVPCAGDPSHSRFESRPAYRNAGEVIGEERQLRGDTDAGKNGESKTEMEAGERERKGERKGRKKKRKSFLFLMVRGRKRREGGARQRTMMIHGSSDSAANRAVP